VVGRRTAAAGGRLISFEAQPGPAGRTDSSCVGGGADVAGMGPTAGSQGIGGAVVMEPPEGPCPWRLRGEGSKLNHPAPASSPGRTPPASSV
jgi:hypothetical protein